jgi:hypothetical protein
MTTRRHHRDGSAPAANEIFVFGFNLSGIHGGGAARAAHDLYGAQWGVAEGRTGSCYAIPTVRHSIGGPLGLDAIRLAVSKFLHHAATHPEEKFFVTRIGCGLAGHKDADIAPMFADAPLNCSLPDTWQSLVAQPNHTGD